MIHSASPQSQAGSDCRLILMFWDGRTLNIVITTGRDGGRGSIYFP